MSGWLKGVFLLQTVRPNYLIIFFSCFLVLLYMNSSENNKF